MKTVNDLIRELQSLRADIREKPVFVIAENGLLMTASAKLGTPGQLDLSNPDIDKVIISYD